jgi:YVTN family beta-propeller protein
MVHRCVVFAAACGMSAGYALGQTGFVNWETPPVSPLALSPSGATLLAVNTADNRVEVFSLASDTPARTGSISVGLDPVSVRFRTEAEAWVVNHISDSVSVVDVPSGRVLRTLEVSDGPADVVFAGSPERAFVSCAKARVILVFDPADPGAAPVTIPSGMIEPRALAVSANGSSVFVASFLSGNKSTIVPIGAVNNPGGPYGGQNPPPNFGTLFEPPIAAGLALPPRVPMIVKQDAAGQWMDDNGGNWSAFVSWGLADRDVGIIDADAPASPIVYATGLMNVVAGLAVRADGRVTAVGTEGTNEVRFEENINGTFVRVNLATFDPSSINATRFIADVNPHLNYGSSSTTPEVREQSVGDPRAITWNAAGSIGYIAGMGSNNVIAVDGAGARLGRVDVGAGPAGLALRESRARLYVLNRFAGSVSEVNTGTLIEVSRVSFYDPTPAAIRTGRPFLYDTHLTSGLGQASCGSCHVDARVDGLAWDLGSPQGQMKTVNQPCRQGPGNCGPWHPMKGPMVTQSLQGIVGNGAMHWRGDKEDLAAFNVAFSNLQGSTQRSAAEMQWYTDFIATIDYPPNPNRNIDNTLRTILPVTGGNGNAAAGLNLYNTAPIFGGALSCAACHPLPSSTDQRIDFPPPTGGPSGQSLKDVQMRGMEEKTGFNKASAQSLRGFGYNHEGFVDSLANMFLAPPFVFPVGPVGAQQRRDLEAFMLSLSVDTHAGVGRQVTLNGANNGDPPVVALLNQMRTIADGGAAALVVKGVQSGVTRGYMYTGGGNYQSDRAAETVTDPALRAAASLGNELTWTLVPSGTQRRIGIDRDADGAFDRDEIDLGFDPADPASTPPLPPCPGDASGDQVVDFGDVTSVLANFGTAGPRGDADHDGDVDFGDVTSVLANFGVPCP